MENEGNSSKLMFSLENMNSDKVTEISSNTWELSLIFFLISVIVEQHDDLEILYKFKEKKEELVTGTGDKKIQGNEDNPAAAITLTELKETLQGALDSQSMFPVSNMENPLNVIDMVEPQNLGTIQVSENITSTSSNEMKKEPAVSTRP